MKEVLGAQSIVMLCGAAAATGTDASVTGLSGTLDTRNPTGVGSGGAIVGQSRHVSILIPRNSLSTNKSIVYTLSHAASVTDAATNGTTLATITQAAALGTALCNRFEVDMLGLQPVLKVLAVPSSGGTLEQVVLSAVALCSRLEQTPITSAQLVASGGTVVVIAAGGVTQSN